MIKKRNGKYVLYTKDGKRVLGTHNTAREAHAQEYALEKSMEKKAVLGPEGTLLGAAIGRGLGSTDEEKARAAAFGGAAAMGAGYAAMPYVFTPAIESLLTKRDLSEFNRGLQRPGLVNKAKTYGEAAGKIFNPANILKLKSPFSYVQQHKSGLDVLKGIASIYPRGLAVAGTAGLLGGLLGKYTADREKTSSIDLLTGPMGAGKSTLLSSIRDQYDLVEGTDLGSVVDGEFVEPKDEDKPRLRQEKADKILKAHSEGKRVLMEGYPPGMFRIPGVVDAADRAVILEPGIAQRLYQIAKRSGDRGTSAVEDVRYATSPEHVAKETKYLQMLRDAIANTYTADTSDAARSHLLNKTSSARRHRATLLIRDPQTGNILARPDEREKAKSYKFGPYQFPGGGVHDKEVASPDMPTRDQILEGAQREALEELGFGLKNPRLLYDYGEELDADTQARLLASRGVPYTGAHEHYVLAEKGEADPSLYNVEGDAFTSGFYVDPEAMRTALLAFDKENPDKPQFNTARAEALRRAILEKTSSDQQDVYVQSAVPTKYLELMKRKGLASQKAIAEDPELLKAFLDVRNLSEEKFRADLAERLDHWQSDSVSGPSVFFTSPDPDKVSDPRHFINQYETSPVKINLSRLIRDMPDTRIAGSELVPYDPDGPEHQGGIRHRDITLEQAAEYARTDPKELWKNYKPEYVGKYYAADVPHAHIVTPSGVIPPEYLEVEKTSSTLYHGSPADVEELVPSQSAVRELMSGNGVESVVPEVKQSSLRDWGVDVGKLPDAGSTNKEASSPILELSQAIQEYETPSTGMGHKLANLSRAARMGRRAFRRGRLSNRTAGNNSRLRGHTRISRRRPRPAGPGDPRGAQNRSPQRATRPMQRVEPNPDAQLAVGTPGSELRRQSVKSIGTSAGAVQMRSQAGDALSAKAIQAAHENAGAIQDVASGALFGGTTALSIRDFINNPAMIPELMKAYPRTAEVARRGVAQSALDRAARRAARKAKESIPGSGVYDAGKSTQGVLDVASTAPGRVSATTDALRRAGQSMGRASDTIESAVGSNRVSDAARVASQRATRAAEAIDNTAPGAIARVQEGAQKIVDFEQQALEAFKSHPRYTEIASGVGQLKRLAAAGDVRGVRELSNRLQRIVGAESSTRSQYLGALLGDIAENRTGVGPLGSVVEGAVGFAGDSALPFLGRAVQTSVGGGYFGPAGGLFKNFITNPLMHHAYSRIIPGYGSAASLYRSGGLGRAGAGVFEELQRLVSSGVPVNDAIRRVERLPGYQTLDRYIAENSRRFRDYLPGMSPLSPASVRRQFLSGLASSLGKGRPLNAAGNPGLGAVGEAEQQILRLQGRARDAATATGTPTFTPFKTRRGIRGPVPHVPHGEMRSGEGFTYGRLMDALGGEAVAVNAPQRVYFPGGGMGYKPRPNSGRVRAVRERLESLGTGDAANRRASVGEVAPILEDIGLVTPGYSSGLSQEALRAPFMRLTEPTRADIRAVNQLRQRLNNLERQGGRGLSTLLPPELRTSVKTSGYKSDLTKTSRATLVKALQGASGLINKASKGLKYRNLPATPKPLSRLAVDNIRAGKAPSGKEKLGQHYYGQDLASAIKTAKEKGTATKRDPKKWAAAKARAKAKMGGKWSARAAQLAVKYYKDSGGRYKGKKPTVKNNKLKKWTKQDWQWSGDVKKEKKKKKKSREKTSSAQDNLRVAILSGSMGDKSRSRALAEAYRDALVSRGADVDFIDMREMGDMPDVITGDDSAIDPYLDRLANADSYVIASPVYNWGPSGRVMNFLDHAIDSETMSGKPYSLLSGAGSPRSALAMGNLANRLDMELKGIGIGAGVQAAGDDYDPETGTLKQDIIDRASSNASRLYDVTQGLRNLNKTAASKGKGVYLPRRAISQLSKKKLEKAEANKRRATNRGEQYSTHGLHRGKKRSKLGSAVPKLAYDISAYRPRGTLMLTDGKGNVFAGKADMNTSGAEATSPYYFPGGGILKEEGANRLPTPTEIEEGIRTEALEELGLDLKDLKVLNTEGLRMDMPEWWRERQRKKRGVEYKGLAEYYASAREAGRNRSLYNVEGDAFDGDYYPIEEVATALEGRAGKEDDPYGEANREQARILRSLLEKQSEAKAMSKEKSALRDLIRGRKLDTDAEPALDVVKMSYFDDVADPDNVRPIDRQERLRGFSQTASDPQYMRPKTPKTNDSIEDSSTNLYNRIGNQDYNQFGEKAVSRLGNLGAYR